MARSCENCNGPSGSIKGGNLHDFLKQSDFWLPESGRPIQWIPGTTSPEVKRPERKRNHSPSSRADFTSSFYQINKNRLYSFGEEQVTKHCVQFQLRQLDDHIASIMWETMPTLQPIHLQSRCAIQLQGQNTMGHMLACRPEP
jgi:hypothetical protein